MSSVAIISDTHLPRGRRELPVDCVERLERADLIIHAGDFVAMSVLERLRELGPPLVGVAGNRDDAAITAALPEVASVTLEGSTLAVIHDAGATAGRATRMRRRFPGADAVIFGHSHIPWHVREDDGFQVFNPGSPTDKRRQPDFTMGWAQVDGAGVAFELVRLTA